MSVGIAAVIAESFARIFFRNCLNLGLLAIWLPDVSTVAREGDELEIDARRGTVRHLQSDEIYVIPPLPTFLDRLVSGGGLLAYARPRVAAIRSGRSGEPRK
jgi:3-isopropylmalate/(R)-2-methylmalate dehydratase small subunit